MRGIWKVSVPVGIDFGAIGRHARTHEPAVAMRRGLDVAGVPGPKGLPFWRLPTRLRHFWRHESDGVSLDSNCASGQNGRGGLFFVVQDPSLYQSVRALLAGQTAPQ